MKAENVVRSELWGALIIQSPGVERSQLRKENKQQAGLQYSPDRAGSQKSRVRRVFRKMKYRR